MTERELIQQARSGDGVAIRSLYQRYADRVYSVVRRLAGDDALAEDWSQEAWVCAIRALPRFRGEARFGTWIHRIAVNSALQGLRARKRHAAREEPLLDRPAPLPSGENALLRLRLERAMDRLPGGMREVLVLHDVEGYTHEEIAERLGIAAGTSKSQLFKARARMRELLRPRAISEPSKEACNT